MSFLSHVVVGAVVGMAVHHHDTVKAAAERAQAYPAPHSTFVNDKGQKCVQICEQSSCKDYCEDGK